MINKKQFIELLLAPTLHEIQMWSQSAENLMLGTLAVESDFGTYLAQYPNNGPALGPYQDEKISYDEIFTMVIPSLSPRQKLILQKNHIFSDLIEDRERLVYDWKFATIICRLHYWRFPEPLPKPDDIEGLAQYWKKYYNTKKGKGTVEGFIKKYHEHVLDG